MNKMTWILVVIAAAVIFGIIGAICSKPGEEIKGCLAGAQGGVVGCGGFILQMFLVALGIFIVAKLLRFLIV